MDFARLSNLDPDQLRVFEADHHAHVLAGPGSGKSTTLVAKFAHLAANNDPNLIGMSTFAKKAAGELKMRLEKLSPGCGGYIGTLHQFGMMALRPKWASQRIKPVIVSQQISEDTMRAAIRSSGVSTEADVESLMLSIFDVKICALAIDPVTKLAKNPMTAAHAMVLADYDSRLAAKNSIDMGDLICHAVTGVRDGTLKLPPLKYFLVDEFQDVDRAQLELIYLYAQSGTKVIVVGDDDQSIYAFRGSLGFHGMSEFIEKTQAISYIMSRNYRSAPAIVESAGKLIEVNPNRFPKKLQAMRATNGTVEVFLAPDMEAAVAAKALDRLKNDPLCTVAIISRNNNTLTGYQPRFMSEGYTVATSAPSFLSRPHVERAMAAMVMPETPDDILSMESSLSFTAISTDGRRKINDYLRKKLGTENLIDLLFHNAISASLTQQDATFFDQFRDALDIIDKAHQKAALEQGGLTDSKLINEVWGSHCLLATTNLAPFVTDQKNRYDIFRLGEIFSHCTGTPLQRKLSLTHQKNNTDSARVTLLTAHASKGLEFDHVFIENAHSGNFPVLKGDLQEERRLFYVGMTRARHSLTLISGTGKKTLFTDSLGISPLPITDTQASVG